MDPASEKPEKSGSLVALRPLQTPELETSSECGSNSPLLGRQQESTQSDENGTCGLFAPIVDFPKGSSEGEKKLRVQYQPLNDVLNSRNPPPSEETEFRWIHIPANHIEWAKVSTQERNRL